MYFARILIRESQDKLVEIVEYAYTIHDIMIKINENYNVEYYEIYKGDELI